MVRWATRASQNYRGGSAVLCSSVLAVTAAAPAHSSPCVSLGLSLQPPPATSVPIVWLKERASWTWLSSTPDKIWMIYTLICHLVHNFPLIIIQKSSGLDLHPLFSVEAKSRVAEHLSARKLSLKMWMMHKDCCVFIAPPVWAKPRIRNILMSS